MEPVHGEAPIDVGELMAMMGGDRALVRDRLKKFSREYDGMIAAVRDAAGRADGEVLEKSAHALKESLTHLAARPAAAAASELETSGRERNLPDLEAKLSALELECGKLWAFLKGFVV